MTFTDLRDWPVSTRAAALCLAVGVVLNLVVVARARSADVSAQVVPLQVARVPRAVPRPRDDDARIREAASLAPFDVAPSASELAAARAAAPPVAPVAAPVLPKLVGTVLDSATGGFVILEMPDARLMVVHVGERAGDLRLRSITTGEAVFDDPHGVRVSLRAPRAGLESRK